MVSEDGPLATPALAYDTGRDDGYDSDENYQSDREHGAMTMARARRKMTACLMESNLDLATQPDYDKPSDENYNVDLAEPILGLCKSFVVEAREAINWMALAVAEDGGPVVHDFQGQTVSLQVRTLTTIYHRMEKEGRAVGPRCLMTLSLILHAYVTCFRTGRLEHLECDDDRPDEDAAPPPPVTVHSVFQMRYVRASPSEDSTRTFTTTGRDLLDMLLFLQRDVDSALLAVGENVPVTWRVLAPHIVFLQQGDADMQDQDGSDSD